MSYFGTKNFIHEAQKGNVSGTSVIQIIGKSDSVGTTLRTLYSETDTADLDTDALFDTPAKIKVASTDNVADIAAGTGALTVRVSGVDSADALATEDFTMNGTTETAESTATFKAIHKIQVLTAGSGQKNVGIIWVGTTGATFTTGVPTVKLGAIEVGTNRSAIGHYLVPTGKKLYITHIDYQLGDSTKTMNVQLETYDGSLLFELYDVHTATSFHSVDHSELEFCPAGTLLRLNANVNTGTAKITVSIGALLVDD